MISKKEMLCWIVLCVLTVCAYWKIGQRYGYDSNLGKSIVRMHVVANSNDEKDQEIKLEVRDQVLRWLLQQSNFEISQTDMENALQRISNGVLRKEKTPYRSRAEIGRFYFPEKKQGDKIYPAGYYDAVLIKLGKAEGKNWWSVLFPDLFLQDCIRYVDMEDEAELKWHLTFSWLKSEKHD